jgi:hypothetical protein
MPPAYPSAFAGKHVSVQRHVEAKHDAVEGDVDQTGSTGATVILRDSIKSDSQVRTEVQGISTCRGKNAECELAG